VASQRQCEFVVRNSAAVVGHDNSLDAAAFKPHVNPRGAGVKRILDQLLYDRSRPLNHFAGGDPAGHFIGEKLDLQVLTRFIET
jgi:hypothetical protein